jgi:hypothetical protein
MGVGAPRPRAPEGHALGVLAGKGSHFAGVAVACVVAFTVGVVAWLAGWHDYAKWGFIGSAAGFAFSIFMLDVRLPSIFARRPVPSGVSIRGK